MSIKKEKERKKKRPRRLGYRRRGHDEKQKRHKIEEAKLEGNTVLSNAGKYFNDEGAKMLGLKSRA